MAAHLGFGEEINVLSDDRIRAALEEQAAENVKPYGGTQRAGAKDADVLSLRVDFQRILRIDNLQAFVNLTRLQLDNNLIEKIENLDSLVNLQWLDLSYNNISRIEGLDNLHKLTDVSLHHNKISKLENMDHLVDLNVFSIGENELESTEEILYLRQFKRLQCLNAAGNPMCEGGEYSAFAMAFLPSLKILDYRRVTPNMVNAAMVKYQDRLETVQTQEFEQQQKDNQLAETEKERRKYENACIPGMDSFVESILDPDLQKFNIISGVPDVVETFKEKAKELLEPFLQFALEHSQTRQQERDEFETAITEGCQVTTQSSQQIVDDFLTLKAKVLASVASQPPFRAQSRISALLQRLADVREELMAAEMELVDEVEQVSGEFERNYQKLLATFFEKTQECFANLRTEEEKLSDEITELASAFFDAYAKGDIDSKDGIPSDTLELLRDKATLTGAISACHDTHVSALYSKEESIQDRANSQLSDLLDSVAKAQQTRNRARVKEIRQFCKFNEDELGLMANP